MAFVGRWSAAITVGKSTCAGKRSFAAETLPQNALRRSTTEKTGRRLKRYKVLLNAKNSLPTIVETKLTGLTVWYIILLLFRLASLGASEQLAFKILKRVLEEILILSGLLKPGRFLFAFRMSLTNAGIPSRRMNQKNYYDTKVPYYACGKNNFSLYGIYFSSMFMFLLILCQVFWALEKKGFLVCFA